MRIGVGHAGWLEVLDLPQLGGKRLYVRVADRSGYLRIAEFYLDSDASLSPVTTKLLSSLPLERIEGFANKIGAEIRDALPLIGIRMDVLASHYGTGFGNFKPVGKQHWLELQFNEQFAGWSGPKGPEKLSQGRDLFALPDDPPPFAAPASLRLSGDFLDQVANVYQWAVASGRAPAPLLAELAGTPKAVRTAQGWIAKARDRGHLKKVETGKRGG